MWTQDKLVSEFLEFFRKKDHKIIESSSLIPKGDKTLLFTSAGMVPFKSLWSGEIPLEYKRAASVQKCLRLSDLEEVGKTYWHDTFFEMLGNFSFGDYFKEEAITWAWEFFIDILKIDPEKLYITIYPDDEESYKIWKNRIGVDEDRIVRHRDNFWGPAGGLGACGPDTEIFYDLGDEFGDCKFDGECERYVEVWNLVFPQYNQMENERVHLKNRGVDTGMGMERLAMVMQEKSSIFETDLFYPIIQETEKISGKKYKDNRQIYNIIADHTRALTFAIADGVYPSNEGRGYVLRRLLRRSLTKSRLIGINDAFIHKLIPVVVTIMENRYPYLKEKREQLSLVVKSEEESFLNTLDTGISILKDIIDKAKRSKKKIISGEDAFKLYDTYGFPLSLTEDMAEEKGLKVNIDEFEEEMKKQKERARMEHEFETKVKVKWEVIKDVESEFTGYEKEESKTEVTAFRKLDDHFEIILKKTPFYAEEGGQIGDKGKIIGDGWEMEVENTMPSPLGHVHIGRIKGVFKPSKVHAEIDRERRYSIMKNHTITHILHKILRENLGDWVKQEGSFVGPEYFRFDFTHPKPLNDEEIDRIEREVNKVIIKGLPVKSQILPFEKAIEKGAVALFNEQYGDEVRMITINDFSRELCGGTHLSNTIEAGIFKITHETGIASGIRRIEGVTGWHAYRWLKEQDKLLQKLEFLMDSDRKSLPVRIEKTLKSSKELKRRIEKIEDKLTEVKFKKLLEEIKEIDGVKYITARLDSSKDSLRKLSDRLRDKLPDGAGLIVSNLGSSIFAVSFVGNNLTGNLDAGKLIKDACGIVGGSGGGTDNKAEGGGNKVEKIGEMLGKFPKIIKKYL